MPLDDNLSSNFNTTAGTRSPAIVTWNRLEGRPQSESFDRSLRAEVRDALWMLSRQWQMGEFRGEDAGTAVFAKVEIDTTRVTRYAVGELPALVYDDSIPLEARIEMEAPPSDDYMRVQMGSHWTRLLRAEDLSKYRELFVAAYPVEGAGIPDTGNAEVYSQSPRRAFLAAAGGRAVDGWRFWSDLNSGALEAGDVTHEALAVDTVDRTRVSELGRTFAAWFDRLILRPESEATSAWVPEHLEYQAACSLPESDESRTVLAADEYPGGHLDWYSFDVDIDGDPRFADSDSAEVDVPATHLRTFLPSPVQFPGMPAPRWWELEDGRTNFGEIDANTTDLARLMLIEFGLVYANDWLIFPFTVPAGTLSTVNWIAVTDVFGARTLIRPEGSGGTDFRWFALAHRADAKPIRRLFVPPVVSGSQVGEPIEAVNFLRDEMANMVWGVETRIPDGLGGGVPGREAVGDLKRLLESIAPATNADAEPLATDAVIRYRLGHTVPEHWIPFLPVHVEGSNRKIQLQRAAMVRAVKGFENEEVSPRGAVLLPPLPEGESYYVYEEEVPRAGAIVRRSWQRARGHDGRVCLWLGRRKLTGRGERSSGLRFDLIEPSEGEADEN